VGGEIILVTRRWAAPAGGRPQIAAGTALVMAAIPLAWLVERRGEALKIEVHRGVRECE
jgi:hypothetical protein